MKKDIQNRADIELLVNHFYNKVKTDKVIGHFFSEVVKVKWDKHIPIMVDFWENVLFFNSDYEGNPMTIHKTVDKKYPMKLKDFNRWIKLFDSTIDELFEGPNANTIKERAAKIAHFMFQGLSKK